MYVGFGGGIGGIWRGVIALAMRSTSWDVAKVGYGNAQYGVYGAFFLYCVLVFVLFVGMDHEHRARVGSRNALHVVGAG